VEFGRRALQQIGPNGGRQPKSQQTAQSLHAAGREASDFTGVSEHASRNVDNLRANRREQNARCSPLYKLNTESILEGFYLLAQRWLGRVDLFRGPAEITSF
jgi:hypothetical protein